MFLMTADVAAALTWPVLSGAALAVLVLLVVAKEVVGRVVTVTHEGGHMVIGVLTGQKVKHFYLNANDDGAATAFHRPLPWLSDIPTTFAGYAAPPLAGLGGAVLLDAGKAWPLLWIAVALLVMAWIKARDELTSVVVLIVAGFTAYVGIYGAPALQAGFAAGLVLLLLLGGLADAVTVPTDKSSGSDVAILARRTLLPASLWKAGHITVAVLCVWKGIQVLTM
jgi:hypothetical protein